MMMRTELREYDSPVVKSTFLVAIFVLGFFALYSRYMRHSSWFYDGIASILLLGIFLIYSVNLRFTFTTATLVSLAVIFHNAGTFGFYAESPLFIQYDHFTHLFGFMACALFLYAFMKEECQGSRMKLYFLVFIASLGVGSLIEMSEFAGYLFLGSGEGMFFLGAGDFGGDLGPTFASDVAREWLDSMWDLVYNAAGAILGLLIVEGRLRWTRKR